ncbi:hypothetical protein ACIBM8_00525 [Micromonospora aurantiaca]|uniref:hypothetical protein n=1 Tax=Micromonospora aurantiaca (nom. illeg.) TaxID=47850 RepID=UPI0037BC92AB
MSLSIGRSSGGVTSGSSRLWCPACGNESNWRDITDDGRRLTATCGDCGNAVNLTNRR